ncbi:MAG: DEAD/DEAH box helicase, partial [Magnetococcales bacterium]|nr:DEAD/DEAH box helicase [Magnetococcales bacterium]
SVLHLLAGQQHRVKRDLVKERREASRIVTTCPTLNRLGENGHEWLIPDLEASLELLLELQALPHPIRIEWPEGERFRLSKSVSSSQLSLKLNRVRDWFHLEGTVQVDENLVIDMQELIERLESAKGRFIPLADGRFLALTRQFQKQLERLRMVSEADSKGRRVPLLGSLAVRDVVEEAGTLQTDRHWKEFSARLKASGELQPTLPSTLQAELRDYQVDGFNWLSRLASWGAGACLSDDMGLGKTVQAIAVLLEQGKLGPMLVIAPTSVCHNWEAEIDRFAPTLRVHSLSSAGDRTAMITGIGSMEVLICSYGLLHQEIDQLAKINWQMMVLDEAQAIKNAGTQRFKAVQRLQANFRLAMTGTPIENYLEELWSQFAIINPGLLGSRDAFQRRFAGPIERNRNDGALQTLRMLIRPFILRRTKSAVLAELPPRTELTLEIELPEEERAFYEALRRKAIESLTQLETGEGGQRRIHILAEITRLRRCCCHPALITPETHLPGAKLDTFLELVDELICNHHKALVFSQFVGQLERVKKALDAKKIHYQYLDGSTPAKDREKRVTAFQNGDGDLFLISLKAGGTGLNLTAADYVIHLDPWWNPAVEDQASDRAHRIGQHRPVTVYRLIVRDSIEQKILQLHRHKRDLASDLLEGAEISGRLSEEDLLDLIRG